VKPVAPKWSRLRVPRPKPVHRGAMVRPNGDVSSLCTKRPRVLDYSRETWTNRSEAVTCQRCRKRLEGEKAVKQE
jgi:hypothetical protein